MTLPLTPSEHLHISLDNEILRLQLNRPVQKNALSLAMYQSLADALVWAAEAETVRVVRLTGSGDSFTAGNDLADFMHAPDLTASHPALQFMRALMAVPQPVVAEVNGLAVGIGTTLLLHCDFVYASEYATFSLPFVKLGLCPEFGASLLLPERIGYLTARQLLMTGEPIDAYRAYQCGLINELLSHDLLTQEVDGLCERLVVLPKKALARSKKLLQAPGRAELEAVIERELAAFGECLKGSECRTALAALMQK